MDTVNDDDATARLFRALSDPTTLELVLEALEAGEREIQVDPQAEPMLLRLATLVDARLMTRAREGSSGPDVYRLTDTAAVERLIATARQLGTDRPLHR
jgi:hypothetical protein